MIPGLRRFALEMSFSNAKNDKSNISSSLFDKLQENKAAQQAEFYEESKEDLAGRNLTDEDVKFLTAVEESKLQRELFIKEENEVALHEFRIRHELLIRESHLKEFSGITEPIKSKITLNDKVKANEKSSLPYDSTIRSKRNLLGIAPKSNK